MADKKYSGRFCLQFNLDDPFQQQTADILERRGRRKASFVTEAVLHYVNCNDSPDIHSQPDNLLLREIVESVVRDCLKNMQSGLDDKHNVVLQGDGENMEADGIPFDVDDDLLNSIHESMALLRDE